MPPKDASIGILRFANTSEITKRTRGKVEISLELVKKNNSGVSGSNLLRPRDYESHELTNQPRTLNK